MGSRHLIQVLIWTLLKKMRSLILWTRFRINWNRNLKKYFLILLILSHLRSSMVNQSLKIFKISSRNKKKTKRNITPSENKCWRHKLRIRLFKNKKEVGQISNLYHMKNLKILASDMSKTGKYTWYIRIFCKYGTLVLVLIAHNVIVLKYIFICN